MNDITPRKLKIGSDPRRLPDYAALRDELSKLVHPARPDVNWPYAEKLCLSLFEQNGVELQTLSWFTLARSQLAGLSGLNEGLVLLEALIRHQWGALWPQPVHARMEILSSLSQRLQQLIRRLPLNYSDRSELDRVEQSLTRLGVVLQRLELKHPSQLDALRTLLLNSAVRLENSGVASGTGTTIQAGIVLPATVTPTDVPHGNPLAEENEPDNTMPGVSVAQTECQTKVEAQAAIPTQVNKWHAFAAGMGTMLVFSVAAAWGWNSLHRQDPLQIQFAASLAPLPELLTPAQLEMMRQQSPLPPTIITQTQQQLVRLDKLSADWNVAYSWQLVEQVQTLWPERAKSLELQWQQQLNAAALPTENLNGWHQGMVTLQQLSDKLNGLDEQKGKYMTVSELKSVVYSARQSFNQSIPAEEQLRLLSKTPAGQPLPSAARTQIDMHLKQLIARYALLTRSEVQGSADE